MKDETIHEPSMEEKFPMPDPAAVWRAGGRSCVPVPTYSPEALACKVGAILNSETNSLLLRKQDEYMKGNRLIGKNGTAAGN